jgi:hypothetical protein
VDLEKALAEQDASSKKNTSEILEKLKLLYEEYKKSLNEFGVRPAPLPDNIEIPEFMDWMETEFKALSEVISGASDFATRSPDFLAPQVLQYFEPMLMFRPSRTSSQGNFG